MSKTIWSSKERFLSNVNPWADRPPIVLLRKREKVSKFYLSGFWQKLENLWLHCENVQTFSRFISYFPLEFLYDVKRKIQMDTLPILLGGTLIYWTWLRVKNFKLNDTDMIALHLRYFNRFIDHSDVLGWDKNGDLTFLGENDYFVFGGDLFDKGEADLRLGQHLLRT